MILDKLLKTRDQGLRTIVHPLYQLFPTRLELKYYDQIKVDNIEYDFKSKLKEHIVIIGSIILWFTILILLSTSVSAQPVGKTQTEQYKASFETEVSIDSLMDYNGPQIPIQILKIGINDEVYEQYPELKEKKVGLGVANIVLEYLENLNRFTFTEDKTEIKNRMVKQFQASQAGISADTDRKSVV
jgi:hypothetical protein